MDKLTKQVNELFRLRKLLIKYSHRYYAATDRGGEPSRRIYNWIDSYDEFKDTAAWQVYCRDNHFDEGHDAFDLFA
jgi:hypothetical protein